MVTNDARVAFVAGSVRRVGLALVCGTGSIAWGRNGAGKIARAGGWGWHVGDEGSGFWIGERAIRAALRATDGRGPQTALVAALLENFGLDRIDQLVRRVYDTEYPRHDVARFAVRVAAAASAGDAVAQSILADAAAELVLAAETVISALALRTAGEGYDVVLSGGTFRALAGLQHDVTAALSHPGAAILPLEVEPAVGAVRLALEALTSEG